ncbi:MAG: glycosyltransferase family 2 protein [Campylobacterales bacterium]|nr:glycosyltransferase family 2 protein [Campylobacterales bacterium]
MNNYILTIAIPTYNRCDLLQLTIESVLSQVGNRLDIEVIIVDNASEDNTANLIQKYQNRVKYIRNTTNIGIDANINKCVFEASGHYVHILSDDDLLIDDALAKILTFINKDLDFIFLNGVIFSESFNPNKMTSYDRIFISNNDYVYTDMNQFLSSIWIWATFVSSFVVKREKWTMNKNIENYIGTDILLSYALVDLLQLSKNVVIIGKPCIAIRAAYSGNYRIIYAFAYQWKKLLLEHAPKQGFNIYVMRKIFNKSILKDLLPRLLAISIQEKIKQNSKEYEYLTYGLNGVWFGFLIKFTLVYLGKFPLKVINKFINMFKLNNLNNSIKKEE